ncbi:MAG TPA: hypothetical protein PK453_18610 [Leptospiraceae bacterium]|nr:hypothetical protein [Leptospiraceae bacterium]HMY67527.1 hypothetical protein [Leptospiraceae bacterium]HNF15683.1 hypothetical protein [Leptospiraceae bacterium]HNF24858.1 hypothetical protein [Leptospiraceae bacterium]HNH07388.1 hypothetical protein [Leptospiraceae bacterium]
MAGADKLSERQVQLIQSAAGILMEHLYMSKEEAVAVIAESLREELKAGGLTFEFLEVNSLSYRQTFIRNLVYRVEKKLENIKTLRKEKIKSAVNIFLQMLHYSWMNEEKT